MYASFDPARLLREARRRAGLTQRDLARRASTSQSVVARIESGRTSPTAETLSKLLEAAGLELRTELAAAPVTRSHMLDDIARIRALTPEERLEEVANVGRFVAAAVRV